MKCYKCQKKRHIKRDCPGWKRGKEKDKEGSSRSANIVAADSDSNGDMLSVSSSANWMIDSWIMDSACSFHMTPHRDWLDTCKSVNCGSVLMINDVACKVIGIGIIKIKTFDNVVRTLGEVQHVLEVKKNLISLETLDSNGYYYKFENGLMKESKGAMVVMKGQKVEGNIYKLFSNIIVGGAIAVTESEQDDTLLLYM